MIYIQTCNIYIERERVIPFYVFFKMSYIKIKQKDIHKVSAIFQLFTNLLRTNLDKKCKIVYVIRIVINEKNNKATEKKDKNAIK